MALLPSFDRHLLLRLLFFSLASASLYLYPHLLSSPISFLFRSFSILSSWLTPPVLFILMNAVVAALAVTSGFLPQARPPSTPPLDDYVGDGKEYDDGLKEEAPRSDFPEVLASFFGDASNQSLRRHPSNSKAGSEPPHLSFAPRPLPPFPRQHAPSNKINGVIKAPAMPLSRYAAFSDTADANVVMPAGSAGDGTTISSPATLSAVPVGIADEKDVDQRATAFIGNFYNKIKYQEPDPNAEMLERSLGS